jgi:hypothetical protein
VFTLLNLAGIIPLKEAGKKWMSGGQLFGFGGKLWYCRER